LRLDKYLRVIIDHDAASGRDLSISGDFERTISGGVDSGPDSMAAEYFEIEKEEEEITRSAGKNGNSLSLFRIKGGLPEAYSGVKREGEGASNIHC